MFQLREEHHRAFDAAAMEAFERRAAAHVRENFPDQTKAMSEDAVRERVRRGLERAKVYGFESERQAIRFIDAGFLLGENFDTRADLPAVRALLSADAGAAEVRSEKLLREAQRTEFAR